MSTPDPIPEGHVYPLTLTALAASCFACGHPAEPTDWIVLENAGARVEFQARDQSRAAGWLTQATAAASRTAAFFGQAIGEPYSIRVYPDRTSFEAWWRDTGFQPACWMIARATRLRVEILSPRLWAAEGCGLAEAEAGQIIAHELVHVLHGRSNPLNEVNFITSLKWFNEGVAVYVAGQLNDGMRARARTISATGPSTCPRWGSARTPTRSAARSLSSSIDITAGPHFGLPSRPRPPRPC